MKAPASPLLPGSKESRPRCPPASRPDEDEDAPAGQRGAEKPPVRRKAGPGVAGRAAHGPGRPCLPARAQPTGAERHREPPSRWLGTRETCPPADARRHASRFHLGDGGRVASRGKGPGMLLTILPGRGAAPRRATALGCREGSRLDPESCEVITVRKALLPGRG